MGDRGDVTDKTDIETSCLQSAESRFTTGARPLDEDLNGANSMFLGFFRSIFGSHLCGKRSAFPRPLEAFAA